MKGASDPDWKAITATEYKLFVIVAFAISLPVFIGGVTPWLLALPALIVIGATAGRIQTVNRQRRETE